MLRKILIGLSLLALTACTGIMATNVVIKNASESAQLKKICRLRPIAVAGFDLVRSQVEVSDAVAANVYSISSQIKIICDDPPTDIQEALVTATKLYADLLDSQGAMAAVIASSMAKQ